MSKPSRTTCKTCGRSLMWHYQLASQPIETDPSPVMPGDPGFVVTRNRRTGRLQWVPTESAQDLGLPPPTEHLRIHRCLSWRRDSGARLDRLRLDPRDLTPGWGAR